MPRLLELFCGTKSVGRAFEAAGWEVVSLDIVSKFEPTILCDIRSWGYTTFPENYDMVWASPVCSRALTTRPRRLLEGDALVLSALEIIAHFDLDVGHREPGHRVADVTPYRKQTRLWTNMRWRPRRSLCKPGSAARRGRTAGTSGPRSGGRG